MAANSGGAASFQPAARKRTADQDCPVAKVLRCIEIPETSVFCCHAFALGDHKLKGWLAVCPNNEEVHVFEQSTDKGIDVLRGHTQRVTGVAWSCQGQLASVSEDRTAAVWTHDGSSFSRVNVELKARKAALCVSWAPNGERFAVGLASRDVAICRFAEDANCWVALVKLGRNKASISSLAWHPTSSFVATGSFDKQCKVYDVTEGTASFNTEQVTETSNAWINAVDFSPSGSILAFAAHDSTVCFKDLRQGPEAAVDVVRWFRLPFTHIAFIDDENLVAAGFDYVPVLFSLQADRSWVALGSLDAGFNSVPRRPPADAPGAGDTAADARKFFTKLASGTTLGEASETRVHANTITGLMMLGDGQFSTSSLDGTVVVWQISR